MLNLFELAKVIKEPVELKIIGSKFQIAFLSCEVADYKNASVCGACHGEGHSVEQAADDYFRKINGKWLIFDALKHPPRRREYSAEIAQKLEEEPS